MQKYFTYVLPHGVVGKTFRILDTFGAHLQLGEDSFWIKFGFELHFLNNFG